MTIMKKIVACLLLISLVFGLVACNTTSFTDSPRIVEAEDLAELLKESNAIVLDARGKEDYDKGHLEGAIHLPPSALTISDPVSGLIAPQDKVESVLGKAGIGPDTKVYIYDNTGGVHASRVWWVLSLYGHKEVRVINNGETAVVESGLPLSAKAPTVEAVEYKAQPLDLNRIAYLEDVMAVVDGDVEGCILDVRSAAEFDEGAIPTATLYPHTKNLYTDGTFRSARDTYLNYKDLGIDRDDLVILYCKSSFRATQTTLLLEEAGYTNVKVYDGAWLEWSQKDMPKEEKVEETAPTTQDAS